MESNEASVQYNRWNEDNMNMQAPHSQTRLIDLYNRLCTGRLGIAMKTALSLTLMVVVYIVGYITGYYVHQC
ncbi:small integral membrane protein 1 [Puntigrus tetrazona]|uniref:small integral membrane protein 1 n=1 Tax=Puntigrus tetrazona TaxID=1606681 RepID=UPI001C8A013E|nr:small integral membrane protein 1 [Puntigrus tetrazona]XP_043103575.1 small integral membrane protein 1 [Puntigrus tetrazona]